MFVILYENVYVMNLKLSVLNILFVLPILLWAQASQETWIRDNYVKSEYMIPMRDGVRLYTAVYTPVDREEKHPFLLTRTPYSCKPYGESFKEALWNSYLYEYMKERYIYVVQDVRGKWKSEGEFDNVRPFIVQKQNNRDVDEASDAYDTVEWLVENISNNNGRVGVFGVSYPGFYSTMAAASMHPAITAVSPQAPVYDWFMGDDFHHNGAFMMIDAFRFFDGFGHKRPYPTDEGPRKQISYKTDSYSFFLKAGTLKNLSRYFGDSIPFWNDMMNHSDYDEWWQSRSAKKACVGLKVPTLIVGGLFDAEDGYGTWHTYRTIKEESKDAHCRLVIGPWSHGAWTGVDVSSFGDICFGSNTAEYYQHNIEIPFFNYYLKDKGSLDGVKEAIVFFSGENKWKEFNCWPPADMKTTDVYLSSGGRLSFEQPNERNSFSEYASDPSAPVPFLNEIGGNRPKEYMVADQRFASQRPDVIVFETDVLSKDLVLAGSVMVDLKTSISTTDADFIVKIIDVFPDDFRYDNNTCNHLGKKTVMGGYQMMVRGDIMRGRYRNSFSTPEAFIPFVPSNVKFELTDIAHTFRKGHKLMIQIQSTWFPIVDRNPQQFVNIYNCSEDDFVKSVVTIYHQADLASKITLPVLN